MKRRRGLKVKRDPLDSLFSKYIRLRDKGICQKCGQYLGLTKGLHCAHYHKRRKQSTRFDPLNCLALCFGCHQYFDENREEKFTPFMVARIGEEAFNKLEEESRKIVKINKEEKKAEIKEWLKGAE